MKKVCILSSLHNWDDVRIYQKQAKSLSKEYDVELHAVGDFEFKEENNIKIYGLKKASKRYLRPLNWIKLTARVLKSDADIYHFHDPELIPIGLIIKLLKRKPVIYDSHENVRLTILNRTWINKNIRVPLSKCFNKFEKFASRRFDLVITVLDEIADEFIQEDVNTAVVKNFQVDTGDTKLEIMKNETVNIVYAGSINEVRGSVELVNSFKYIKNPNVRLYLIGSFSSESVKNQIMKSVEADNRISYLGLVSYDEAQKLLKTSDIGIVSYKPGPNHDFCLPNKIFEYMSVGVPIIATNIKYWYDNFNKYNCILFIDKVTENDIADAINYLVDNKEEAIRMGRLGYNVYKENFTWQSQEEILLEQYKKLLNK
ncbi:glycosyltransferase family 4 protein [Clostridium sp. NSJ-145]|uniref:glycosyltransferase family 4 protein n=1 Tax=Clostridium sp. NSJ-145 TaxID=2897777 RepID=UPI001E38FBD5|nr:glycosyltransferase family 4 protein [Clostridium sp. NSJ-145]MCD2502376.1 glycosyltransferase family 4 protein [Clostridium sp. NSJ-145]